MDDAPLRFGILGTGRIAGKLADAMARCPAATAAAVGSRDAARAAAFAQVYDVPESRGDYLAVVEHPDVDAVYVALPPHRHEDWVHAAARAGKPALCEKPLAPTAEEAGRMAEVCDKAGVALLDGTQWTRTARADRLRTLIDGDAVGRVTRVTAAFSFPAEGWGATEHRLDPHRGGGVLLDLAWYCVHAALWATGEMPDGLAGHLLTEPSPVAGSSVAGSSVDGSRAGPPVDVAASASLRFPGGATAGLDAGYRTAWRNWLEVAGTAGSVVCDDFTAPRDPRKCRFFRHDARGEAERIELPPCDQPVEFLTRAAAALRGPGDPAGLALALRTQAVLDALREAAG